MPAAAVAAGEGDEPHPSAVRYDDWIELLCDLVRAERAADPRPAACAAATQFAWMARPAPTLLRAIEPVLGRVRLPIRWLADVTRMSTDPRLSRSCASDPRGGGVSVLLGFLASWMNFAHTAPESSMPRPSHSSRPRPTNGPRRS